MSFRLSFEKDVGYSCWKVKSWTISYTLTGKEPGLEEFGVSDFQAPLSFSYACGMSDIKMFNVTGKGSGLAEVSLNITGFQVCCA